MVISQGRSTEVPQNQVVVHVVPRFLDRDTLEETEVSPKDVDRTGPHLLVA